MTRATPPSDWVAYSIVIGVVIAIMYGKYLIARGDKNDKVSHNDKSENNR